MLSHRHAFAALLLAASTSQALAQAPATAPAPADTPPAVNTGIWDRPNLLGDLLGLRTRLATAGMTLSLIEESEVLGNVSGGLKRGATYDGQTTLTFQLDTEKAGLWKGGLFNISGLQLHGRDLSRYYLPNLQTASGIEAEPTTRLWELWYQHSLLDGALDVKLGLQSIDQEFITSSVSSVFVNTMMGWPIVPSVDLYAGGPTSPLSSLGIRLRGTLMENVTLLGGVFQDNPPGGPFNNDGQLRGSSRTGGNFNLRTGALFIAEAQYALNQPATDDTPNASKPTGLPAAYKLGAYYDTAGFPDQRVDSAGVPLAASASNGRARLRPGNFSIYGIIDQGIWQPASDSPQLVSVFLRALAAPGDRNLVNFSLDAGVTIKAPLPSRDSDTLGLGIGYASISASARGADRDRNTLAGIPLQPFANPVRGSETFIELTYRAQVTPWLQLQPDVQYVFTPGGGLANPNLPGKRIGNEAILGVRTSITF